MQHVYESFGKGGARIKLLVRDGWIDDSAPTFDIEALALNSDLEGKSFIERAMVHISKDRVMVSQGHGGASSHFASRSRHDRGIQQQLMREVGNWIREVVDPVEMALEGEPEAWIRAVSGYIERLEQHISAVSQGADTSADADQRDRRLLDEKRRKVLTIALRMSCATLLFLKRAGGVSPGLADELLDRAAALFHAMLESDVLRNDDQTWEMSKQAREILAKYGHVA